MEGQMTIFDFIPTSEQKNDIGNNFPPIIRELSRDIWKTFKSDKHEDEAYEVWSHVPNLGKRYVIWIEVKDILPDQVNALKDKYKKYDLELSFIETPEYDDDYNLDHFWVMISSIWKTKGHKERLDAVLSDLVPCPHKEKCYNHPAGCKGLSYWCKRYDKEGEK